MAFVPPAGPHKPALRTTDTKTARPSKADKAKRVAFADGGGDGDKGSKTSQVCIVRCARVQCVCNHTATQKPKKLKHGKAGLLGAAERERKVREVPVAAVAKATAWDTVLGHAWEDTGERSHFR